MANNLLAFRCAGCGAAFWFGKYYPSTGWWVWHDSDETFGRELRAFIEEHSDCREDWPEDENAGAYELLYQVTEAARIARGEDAPA